MHSPASAGTGCPVGALGMFALLLLAWCKHNLFAICPCVGLEWDMVTGTQEASEQINLNLQNQEFASDPKDWMALRMLLDEIDEEMRMQREALLMRVAQWLVAHSIFRKVEKRKLVMSTPGVRDLEFHDALASSLIGAGKLLVLELREHSEIDPKYIGIRFEDFRATVAGVERDHLLWHSGMTEEREEAILGALFNEGE